MAGVRDTGIEKELMSADYGMARRFAETLHDGTRQLIGSGSSNYVRIVDADENQLDIPGSADSD